ncbi:MULTISPECIES: hypothetical protein [Corallococcus]|uniref:hypothetical protein n=1 Tax=Corallococcus TaxID=83461 RepID=UPI00118162F7|nr:MULTISPECIES: hypothetical protein [Corallococcus]NBD13436.1 hypothetical protein [Corallococcus silvisoli]TSC25837.1 hypothetical protein FOF48_22785 [Corallococcus sp. Z5C101001]
MSERQIEMFWRCTNCTHRNLGRHTVCQFCKNAKDGSEQYEMPEDTASAVTVTDAALLRMATAGPNWRCAYCDSDQRAFDGSCRNCGAAAPASEGASPAPAAGQKTQSSFRRGCGYALLVVVFFGCCCPFGIGAWNAPAPSAAAISEQVVPAGPEWTRALQVKEVAWEHTVTVERYHLVDHEGFAEDRPEGALQVRAQGRRHHHDDQVPDGYETVYYTEQRQSGYTTETYREKEACGEDCSTTPETCKENCTSNRNGFATCKTTCTGGGRRCTTRYCSVTKTRKEPRYVDVRLSRQEPRYRTVSRDAQWYAWKEWNWTFERTVKASGTTLETRWPSDAELRPARALPKGEKERNSRGAKYTVAFQGEGHPPVAYTPETLEEFQRFAIGSTHTLQQDKGKVSVVTVKAPEPAPAK